MTEMEQYLVNELERERQKSDALLNIILEHIKMGPDQITVATNEYIGRREPWYLRKVRLEKMFATVRPDRSSSEESSEGEKSNAG